MQYVSPSLGWRTKIRLLIFVVVVVFIVVDIVIIVVTIIVVANVGMHMNTHHSLLFIFICKNWLNIGKLKECVSNERMNN